MFQSYQRKPDITHALNNIEYFAVNTNLLVKENGDIKYLDDDYFAFNLLKNFSNKEGFLYGIALDFKKIKINFDAKMFFEICQKEKNAEKIFKSVANFYLSGSLIKGSTSECFCVFFAENMLDIHKAINEFFHDLSQLFFIPNVSNLMAGFTEEFWFAKPNYKNECYWGGNIKVNSPFKSKRDKKIFYQDGFPLQPQSWPERRVVEEYEILLSSSNKAEALHIYQKIYNKTVVDLGAGLGYASKDMIFSSAKKIIALGVTPIKASRYINYMYYTPIPENTTLLENKRGKIDCIFEVFGPTTYTKYSAIYCLLYVALVLSYEGEFNAIVSTVPGYENISTLGTQENHQEIISYFKDRLNLTLKIEKKEIASRVQPGKMVSDYLVSFQQTHRPYLFPDEHDVKALFFKLCREVDAIIGVPKDIEDEKQTFGKFKDFAIKPREYVKEELTQPFKVGKTRKQFYAKGYPLPLEFRLHTQPQYELELTELVKKSADKTNNMVLLDAVPYQIKRFENSQHNLIAVTEFKLDEETEMKCDELYYGAIPCATSLLSAQFGNIDYIIGHFSYGHNRSLTHCLVYCAALLAQGGECSLILTKAATCQNELSLVEQDRLINYFKTQFQIELKLNLDHGNVNFNKINVAQSLSKKLKNKEFEKLCLQVDYYIEKQVAIIPDVFQMPQMFLAAPKVKRQEIDVSKKEELYISPVI